MLFKQYEMQKQQYEMQIKMQKEMEKYAASMPQQQMPMMMAPQVSYVQQ